MSDSRTCFETASGGVRSNLLRGHRKLSQTPADCSELAHVDDLLVGAAAEGIEEDHVDFELDVVDRSVAEDGVDAAGMGGAELPDVGVAAGAVGPAVRSPG